MCYNYAPYTQMQESMERKTAQLRRSGGSLTVTVPAGYRKANDLKEGEKVELKIDGDVLSIRPACRKVTLQAILDSAPRSADEMRAEGWDEMREVGREL